MYELEQRVKQLEKCECRIACRWSAPDDSNSSSSYNDPDVDHRPSRSARQDLEQTPERSSNETPPTTTMSSLVKTDGQVWWNKCNVCSCHVSKPLEASAPAK